MRVIENFNESATKSKLAEIKRNFTSEVSFGDIYDTLSMYSGRYPASPVDDLNIVFPEIMSQLGLEGGEQKQEEVRKYYCYYRRFNNYAYNRNLGYYHLQFSGDKPSERMIINIATQQDTINLIRQILSKYYADNNEFESISSIKFYAGRRVYEHVKFDKIVIYYNATSREKVASIIYDAAIKANVTFLPDNSAFYNIVTVSPNQSNEKKYCVGIGVEIGHSSFTTERAKEILTFMTGKTITEQEEDIKYPVTKEVQEMDETTFQSEAYNLCIKNCKPL